MSCLQDLLNEDTDFFVEDKDEYIQSVHDEKPPSRSPPAPRGKRDCASIKGNQPRQNGPHPYIRKSDQRKSPYRQHQGQHRSRTERPRPHPAPGKIKHQQHIQHPPVSAEPVQSYNNITPPLPYYPQYQAYAAGWCNYNQTWY